MVTVSAALDTIASREFISVCIPLFLLYQCGLRPAASPPFFRLVAMTGIMKGLGNLIVMNWNLKETGDRRFWKEMAGKEAEGDRQAAAQRILLSMLLTILVLTVYTFFFTAGSVMQTE